MFSFEKTKQAIKSAIQEAAGLEPAERAKRIKSLRLRWHPGVNMQSAQCQLSHRWSLIDDWAAAADKNPDFALEFANEVTKIINETVAELQI